MTGMRSYLLGMVRSHVALVVPTCRLVALGMAMPALFHDPVPCW